jgi:hypothetical protein
MWKRFGRGYFGENQTARMGKTTLAMGGWRTLSWLANSRRLAKDYEIRTYYSEAMIQISHLHTLLKRL